ncbi:MAG: DUF393 domain-containing protein [Chromatiales bacterium]|nr:DUF393 domain-containing protein [Gammaproteobacteria bacterium]MBW6476740.1 DUF393 domain-containing protein [Chromatiales bacterium]
MKHSKTESPQDTDSKLQVFYDGDCPLCAKEINIYRGLDSHTPIHWRDISKESDKLPAGVTQETLLKRFHVIDSQGQLQSGANAFIALWASLPGWRWLARLAAIPGVRPLMEVSYRGFLRIRPGLQSLVRRYSKEKNG